MPQAKRDMIGRLGELIVYHWLKERFPSQDVDAAWVSNNGNEQLGRSQGSDDLGFDFRVEYRRQTWQIEVKASVGDQQRFEMGETEVRAARDAARPRSNTRYVVVYVANPHNPANAHIDVLPNPMSPEADGVLDLLGEGVRFCVQAPIRTLSLRYLRVPKWLSLKYGIPRGSRAFLLVLGLLDKLAYAIQNWFSCPTECGET